MRIIVTLLVFALLGAASASAAGETKPAALQTLSESERAALRDIAALVTLASGGKTALAKNGVVGRPNAGVAPAKKGKRLPEVMVWPVSEPVRTRLEGGGEGKILGAIRLPEAAVAPADNKTKAPAGVYLVFVGTIGSFGGFEVTANEISLVSVTGRDTESFRVEQRLKTPLLGHEPEKGSAKPEVTVEFPEPGEVTGENPACRVTVGMKWKEHLFRFKLDLDISMI